VPETPSGPADEDALEPFCTTCGDRASIFTDRGDHWLHYTGESADRTVRP
jgi:hypothetical protein